MVFLTSPAFSNFISFAKTLISFLSDERRRDILPSKSSLILRIVRAYSFFEISPVQVPGQRPICLLKHGLPILMFLRTSEYNRSFCLAVEGTAESVDKTHFASR